MENVDFQNTLLIKNGDDNNKKVGFLNGGIIRLELVREEAKKQILLGGPLIAVSLLQFSIQLISIMFVGHLGELALSSASLGTSFSCVVGASVLVGMASALETLCGQSYGAKQYKMLGIYTQRAMICLEVATIPLAIVWYYTGDILILCGQDYEISKGAETFNRWMTPTLFSYAILQCLNRFASSEPCPSNAGVFGLEYASLELVVLLSGLLPNPKLETSVLSINLNTCWLVYMTSFGLGGTISTRVANELGAGRPEAAKLALFVMAMISLSEGLIVVALTLMVRNIWGRMYSNEAEVINYAAKMMPLLALSDFIDGFQCVLSGAARGCGWQKLCAFINLGAYYFIGIPAAVILAFFCHVGGMGLWIGVICGLSVQVIILFIINLRTDWEKEADKARFRVVS